MCSEKSLEEKFLQLKNNAKNTNNEFQLRNYLKHTIDSIVNKEGILEENRIDLYYSDVVIETKSYKRIPQNRNTKEFLSFEIQTKNYMQRNNISYGILTDCEQIFIYKLDGDINLINEKDTQFNFNNFQRLVDLIQSDNREILISPFSLLFEFNISNYFVMEIIKELFILFNSSISITHTTTKTKLFFLEWEKLFRLSEEDKSHTEDIQNRRMALKNIFEIEINDNNEYQALFVLHTLLSIIVKLLSYNIIIKLKSIPGAENNGKEFFKKIESGEFFRNLGISNMSNFDFFSWYLYETWDNKLEDRLKILSDKVKKFKTITSAHNNIKDYFQKLYENYIPKEVRHSFGEYYTPDWLSDFITSQIYIEELQNNIDACCIDPTCGSGTFLNSVIKIKKEKQLPLDSIVKQVVGIDLNPIAILMAKFNYIINISDLIEQNITDLEIPIYLGDSSYTPEINKIDNVEYIEYEYYFPENSNFQFPKIIFPKSFVKSPSFISVINEVENKINANNRPNSIFKYLMSKITETSGEIHREVQKSIKNLIEKICEYQAKNLNSIWLFIFMNYLKPFSMEKFDLVIGNPPWVRWSFLPTAYKNKIKATLREEFLFSSDKNVGGIDLNIFALIAFRVLSNLTKPNGYLVFLMPESVLKNKSFEGFRSLTMNNGKIGTLEKIYKPKKNLKVFRDTNLPFIVAVIRSTKRSFK